MKSSYYWKVSEILKHIDPTTSYFFLKHTSLFFPSNAKLFFCSSQAANISGIQSELTSPYVIALQ